MSVKLGKKYELVAFFIYFCRTKACFVDKIEKIQSPIAEDLARYRELFAQSLAHDNPLLQAAVSHLMNRTGKVLRPTLVLLSARMFGSVNENVLNAALALELIHTASLIHDDVVDESDRRRGQASINALLGNKVAVLVGDYILSKSLIHGSKTGSIELISHLAELCETLSDGELLQLNKVESELIDEASYYEVIRKKTASLFAICAQTGVQLAGGSEEDAERMRQFGQLVGTAFQLRDDIFDYGMSDLIGKPVGNDMKEGKLTLPVIYALHHSKSDAMLQIANKVRAGEASSLEISQLVQFAKDEGGIDYAEWAMKEFRIMALGLIDDNRDPAIAESLREYVDFVSERTF